MGTGQSKEEQLYHSAQLGNHQVVKSLRRDGASLEWVDKEGRTPLLLACTRAERFDMVITLLNLGANLNAYRPGAHGGFALHHAAKRGLDKTVVLLLSRGADPLSSNDDGQTPLDMARLRGHLSTVRLIEDHICLFSGDLREIYGPGFLEVLAPQWVTRKIWAVVLPAESRSRRRPPRNELVIYPSSKVAQPRIVISLNKAAIDEPRFNAPDPVLVITDRSTRGKFKFLSGIEGNKEQLGRLYQACRVVHPLDGGPPTEVTLQEVPGTTVETPPLGPVHPSEGSAETPEDVAFVMAINASLQSALSGGAFPDPTPRTSEANNCKGWASVAEESCNGSDAPDIKLKEDSVDEQAFPHNKWGSSEAGPSTSHSSQSPYSLAATGPVSAAEAELLLSSQASSSPSTTPPSHAIRAPSTIPSAPPLPLEYAPSMNDLLPIHYPSIDASPVDLNYSPEQLSHQPPTVKEEADGKGASVCVVCWDSPPEAVCIPCGHLAGCMECLTEIKSKKWGCPICRAGIDQVVKVYKV